MTENSGTHDASDKGLSFFRRAEETTRPVEENQEEPTRLGLCKAGQMIGEFQLVRCLGRGGMGEVWEAVQESLNRSVALKVLLPGRGTREFAREARAGGRLNHPGIVSVHGSGETEGIRWIAMELVEGGHTIGDFIREIREEEDLPEGYYRRVCTLVAEIAEAIGNAHDEGVIHRDIKPMNILVTAADTPKVVDFGLAKVVDEQSLSQTGDFAGTYFYMSPEQVAARRMGLDHRTDIFSLGVVFYELLSLQRPFEGDTTQQIAQKILLHDPPDPKILRSRVPPDLSVIVGQCLEKDPARRYQTMGELAADLRRHLAAESILAKPPSPSEKALKWVRRNPTKSAVMAVTTAALVVISTLFVQNIEKTRQLGDQVAETEKAWSEEKRQRGLAEEGEEFARAMFVRSTAVNTYHKTVLRSLDPKGIGERFVRSLETQLVEVSGRAGLSESQQDDLLQTFRDLTAKTNPTDAGLAILEDEVLAGAAHWIDDLFAEQPEQAAYTQKVLAGIYAAYGLNERAGNQYAKALGLRRAVLGDDHEDTITSVIDMGVHHYQVGQIPEAQKLFEEGIERGRRILGPDHTDLVTALGAMGSTLMSKGELEVAAPYLEEALEICQRAFAQDDPSTLTALTNMGSLLFMQGKYSGAVDMFENLLETTKRIKGEDDPSTIHLETNISVALIRLERHEEAATFLRSALKNSRSYLGDNHPTTIRLTSNLAVVLKLLGEIEEAEAMYMEALERGRVTNGDNHSTTMTTLNNLGMLLWSTGRLEEAETYFIEALEGRRRLLGDAHPDTVHTMMFLGDLYADMCQMQGKVDRFAEAETLLLEALDHTENRYGPSAPQAMDITSKMVELLSHEIVHQPGKGHEERLEEWKAKLEKGG